MFWRKRKKVRRALVRPLHQRRHVNKGTLLVTVTLGDLWFPSSQPKCANRPTVQCFLPFFASASLKEISRLRILSNSFINYKHQDAEAEDIVCSNRTLRDWRHATCNGLDDQMGKYTEKRLSLNELPLSTC